MQPRVQLVLILVLQCDAGKMFLVVAHCYNNREEIGDVPTGASRLSPNEYRPKDHVIHPVLWGDDSESEHFFIMDAEGDDMNNELVRWSLIQRL